MVSSKSDVWAYGVTVWEIFSYGDIPYGNRIDNKNIKMQVIKGLRLECPIDCTDDIYKSLMSDCWLDEPKKRPNFENILANVRKLRKLNPVESPRLF